MTQIRCITVLHWWVLKRKTRQNGAGKPSEEATSEQIWHIRRKGPESGHSVSEECKSASVFGTECRENYITCLLHSRVFLGVQHMDSAITILQDLSLLFNEILTKSTFSNHHLVLSCRKSLVMSSVLGHVFRKRRWRRLLFLVLKRLSCKLKSTCLLEEVHLKNLCGYPFHNVAESSLWNIFA